MEGLLASNATVEVTHGTGVYLVQVNTSYSQEASWHAYTWIMGGGENCQSVPWRGQVSHGVIRPMYGDDVFKVMLCHFHKRSLQTQCKVRCRKPQLVPYRMFHPIYLIFPLTRTICDQGISAHMSPLYQGCTILCSHKQITVELST